MNTRQRYLMLRIAEVAASGGDTTAMRLEFAQIEAEQQAWSKKCAWALKGAPADPSVCLDVHAWLAKHGSRSP